MRSVIPLGMPALPTWLLLGLALLGTAINLPRVILAQDNSSLDIQVSDYASLAAAATRIEQGGLGDEVTSVTVHLAEGVYTASQMVIFSTVVRGLQLLTLRGAGSGAGSGATTVECGNSIEASIHLQLPGSFIVSGIRFTGCNNSALLIAPSETQAEDGDLSIALGISSSTVSVEACVFLDVHGKYGAVQVIDSHVDGPESELFLNLSGTTFTNSSTWPKPSPSPPSDVMADAAHALYIVLRSSSTINIQNCTFKDNGWFVLGGPPPIQGYMSTATIAVACLGHSSSPNSEESQGDIKPSQTCTVHLLDSFVLHNRATLSPGMYFGCSGTDRQTCTLDAQGVEFTDNLASPDGHFLDARRIMMASLYMMVATDPNNPVDYGGGLELVPDAPARASTSTQLLSASGCTWAGQTDSSAIRFLAPSPTANVTITQCNFLDIIVHVLNGAAASLRGIKWSLFDECIFQDVRAIGAEFIYGGVIDAGNTDQTNFAPRDILTGTEWLLVRNSNFTNITFDGNSRFEDNKGGLAGKSHKSGTGAGAIYVLDDTRLHVLFVDFINNHGGPDNSLGGAVLLQGNQGSFTACTFHGNTAALGGAILAIAGARLDIDSGWFADLPDVDVASFWPEQMAKYLTEEIAESLGPSVWSGVFLVLMFCPTLGSLMITDSCKNPNDYCIPLNTENPIKCIIQKNNQ
eukprot:gene6667-3331_t